MGFKSNEKENDISSFETAVFHKDTHNLVLLL